MSPTLRFAAALALVALAAGPTAADDLPAFARGAHTLRGVRADGTPLAVRVRFEEGPDGPRVARRGPGDAWTTAPAEVAADGALVARFGARRGLAGAVLGDPGGGDADLVARYALYPGTERILEVATGPDGETTHAQSRPDRRVLFIVSGGGFITLGDGRRVEVGTFLIELIPVVEELTRRGVAIDIRTPTGTPPRVDVNGLGLNFYDPKPGFGLPWFVLSDLAPGDREINPRARAARARRDRDVRGARRLLGALRLTAPLLHSSPEAVAYGDELLAEQAAAGTRPRELGAVADLTREELLGYAGVFVPGGHAPMVDLPSDPHVGRVLRHFHALGKPTGLICHGPIALLAARDDPGREGAAPDEGWIYAGYRITVLTTFEERLVERFVYLRGPDGPGRVPFYVDAELERFGAVLDPALPWRGSPLGLAGRYVQGLPRVVHDREVITGQNPASVEETAAAFGDALDVYLAGR